MGFGGIIAGALGGAGRAVEDIGTMRLGQIAQRERDERLAEIARESQERGFKHAEGLQKEQIAATERQGEASRTHQSSEAERTRAHQSAESEKTRTHQSSEQSATRALQVMLADMHERAATQRHGQSMGLQIKQMEQALKLAELNKPLQVNEKGEFFYRDSNGNTQFVYDPSAQEGGRMKSPRDLTTREKAVLEAQANAVVAQIKELAKSDPLDTPQSRAEKQAQITALVQSLHTPQGAATPQQQKPTDAHVDALKKRASDPKARAAFDQQYGAGAADRVLGAKPAEPEQNAGGGMVTGAMDGGPSDSEFDSMVTDAKRGGEIGRSYLREKLDAGVLSLRQRLEAQSIIGK